MTLPELRQRIDNLDEQLLDLLQQRARIAREVAAVKLELGRPLAYDPERERQVLERIVGLADPDLLPVAALESIFREVISACLALQRPLTVAYLGPEGTYSQMAALRFFGDAALLRDAATIDGVIDAVQRGEASRGVLPLQNSTEGSVAQSVRALLGSDLFIERELVMDVAHCLLSRAANLPMVRRVYSHPQALGQCVNWLRRNLPDVELVHSTSTAAAVRSASHDPTAAAIGSRLAGRLADVPVLADNVQDMAANATRFVVVGPADAAPTDNDTTLVAFSLRDGPGALRRALGAFDDAGVSLTHIESHPSRDHVWAYVFVVEMDGHRLDPACERALRELETFCVHIRVLGSFARAGRSETAIA
jgi:chorismate mutase/prephenate dehydratase